MATTSYQPSEQHLILDSKGELRDCLEIQVPWLMIGSFFLLIFCSFGVFDLLGFFNFDLSPDVSYVLDKLTGNAALYIAVALAILAARNSIATWGWNKVMDWWKPHSPRTSLKLFLMMLGFIFLVEMLTVWLLEVWDVNMEELPQQEFYKAEPGVDPAIVIVIDLISTVVFAPLSEEFVFRRFLPRLFSRWPTILNETICSLAFAAVHGIPQSIPLLFTLSMFLFRARRECGLLTGILLHASYNLLISINIISQSGYL